MSYNKDYWKSYHIKNKEKIKEYKKTLVYKFHKAKYSAKRRGYEFNFTLEEFIKIISGICIYCGENQKRIGIDRIDNTIGYTKENSVACCAMCNYMKKNYTKEEFLQHVKKIVSFNSL